MLRKTAIGLAAATIAIGGSTLSVSAQMDQRCLYCGDAQQAQHQQMLFDATTRHWRAATYGMGSGGARQYGAASSGRGVTRSTRPHR